MLPFTKRPGRSEDGEPVKDETKASGVPSKRSAPPPSIRPPLESQADDDETGILQAKGYGKPASVLPAAGRSPSGGPPRSTLRPPPPSLRPPPHGTMNSAEDALDDDEDAEDENGGRTVVRGAPRIKRVSKGPSTNRSHSSQHPQPHNQTHSQPPPSMSPGAVIKATLESARANRREVEFAQTEDFNDKSASKRSPFGRSQPPPAFEGPPSLRPPPMAMEGPPSYPPGANYSGGTLPPAPPSSARSTGSNSASNGAGYSGGYAPVPGVAGGPMPAHFQTPRAPHSDPPGTAVTSGHRAPGRPAMSWAAALLACGLFVGVAAVAVMQSSEAVADTTASFVDPARAPLKVGATQTPVPVNALGEPAAFGALPAAPAPLAAPPPEAPAAAPVVTAPAVPAVAAAPAPKKPVFSWKPAGRPAAAVKAEKAEKAAEKAEKAADEEPKEAKKEKPGKKKGSGEDNDETKKALDALQKAQLESASSF